MIGPLTAKQFLAAWAPALAISAAAKPPTDGADLSFALAGVSVPIVTCGLGLLGVLCARPLALPKERSHGTARFILVSVIMLIVVELWIIEAQPRWLFAFVVAIGVGFSGYSLIELLGDQIKDLITSGFTAAKNGFGSLFKTSNEDDTNA